MKRTVRRWNSSTKRIVAVILLVIVALLLYRFRSVIPPLVIAFLLAFILDPIVGFLVKKIHISRPVATTMVFLVMVIALLVIVALPVAVMPSLRRAVIATQQDVIRIINEIGSFLNQPLEIWGYTLDLSGVYEELSQMLRSFVGSVAQGTLELALNVASGAFWSVFILIVAFYLVRDAKQILTQVNQLAPPSYRDDFIRLRREVARVWNGFLRGQLILGTVMMVATTIIATAIGLPYALALGLLAGVMEFVPNLGPYLMAIPAVLIAYFRGSTFINLSNFWFAVLVAGIYFLIQQIENNYLVPRILGGSLDMHPLVVLIGIVIGGNLAGILGMLLAAPVLATLRVFLHYIFSRLYDRDPFEEHEREMRAPPEKHRPLKRIREVTVERLQQIRNRKETVEAEGAVRIEVSEVEEDA